MLLVRHQLCYFEALTISLRFSRIERLLEFHQTWDPGSVEHTNFDSQWSIKLNGGWAYPWKSQVKSSTLPVGGCQLIYHRNCGPTAEIYLDAIDLKASQSTVVCYFLDTFACNSVSRVLRAIYLYLTATLHTSDLILYLLIYWYITHTNSS